MSINYAVSDLIFVLLFGQWDFSSAVTVGFKCMRFDRTSFNNENKQIDKGKPEKGINDMW